MADLVQNPYTCGDGGCVLRVPSAPTGMHTNAGCRCLMNPMAPDRRVRVRKGISWLAQNLDSAWLVMQAISRDSGYSMSEVSDDSP